MAIFVSADLTKDQVARLRDIAAGEALHLHGGFADGAPIEPGFTDCDIVFGNVPATWLQATRKLRWVQLESVGFAEYAEFGASELGKGIALTNLAAFFSEPVAESALAGILALYRGIDRLVRLQGAKDWRGDKIRKDLRTLAGAKVVLFGYGSINRRLAALLAPFDCDIAPFGSGWKPEALDRALTTADIVVSCAPDTDTTRTVFGRARLARLPERALFVNFGRGSVVDEEALADALAAGRLGGAVIDVTLDEPLPKAHRFWTCPNTIVTQHSGGGTGDEIDRKIEVFADNLSRFRAGRPLVGVVDFTRGY